MSSWTFSFWNLIKHLDFRRTCVLPWRLVNLHFKPCVEVIQWIWKGGIRLYFKVGDGLTTLAHVACVSSVQDWGCPEGFLVTWCEAASQVFSSTSAEMSDDNLRGCHLCTSLNIMHHSMSINVSEGHMSAKYWPNWDVISWSNQRQEFLSQGPKK